MNFPNHPRRRRCRLLWRPSQKFTEIVKRFFLLKQRKVPFVFSTSLLHSCSFYDVLWYTMWLCRWWCFVCISDSFWCVFLPTFGSCFLGGWFAQQSCRKRGRPSEMPDFCTSYLRRLRDLRIQGTRLHCSTWTEVWLGWLVSTWWCLHWDQNLHFGFSSFINHQIQLDALHPTHQFFQFVSDWQNEIWTDFCHFDILCDLPWRYHDIFPPYSNMHHIHMFGFGRIWPRIACSMLPKFFRPAWKWSTACCAVGFCPDNHSVSHIFQQWDTVFFLSGKWENLSRLFWITRMGEVSQISNNNSTWDTY